MPYRAQTMYHAFGLSLQSALSLPELRQGPAGAGAAEVVVALGTASRPTAGIELNEAHSCVGPDLFWLDVPGIAKFLVRNGRQIVVEADPGAGEGDVRAYLLGSGIGAILHQRGWLPLHASAVEIDGRAVAFIAPSGGGKSTMAMYLNYLGYRALCDDICAIDLRGARPRLWPGLRNLKLWRTSLTPIGRTPDGLEPVVANADKYRMPIDCLSEYRPYDLDSIVVLDWGENVEQIDLKGAAGMTALIANTFRGQLVAPMHRESAHWHQCLKLVRTIGIKRITRPYDMNQLDVAALKITGSTDIS